MPRDASTPPLTRAEPLPGSAVLTHHWLVRERGGEKVLRALCELLPGAPLYTLVHDPRTAGAGWPTIHTSFLQALPGARRHYPKLLPLMPLAARRIKLPPADLVVCSDAAIAKAMSAAPRSRLICYCHSPMRYIYEPDVAAAYRATLPTPLRPLFEPLAAYLRRADQRAAARVDCFVANSRTVAERIRRCYGRDSAVIYPPVELPAAPAEEPREDFYLCVGYHVAYKRLDLAVAACAAVGRRLVVIGSGPEADRLAARPHPHVTWLGWQPPTVIADHYRRARALLFPGEEDFGIVPVEALAHGCPVIALARGGATESVEPGVGGVLFETQSADALAAAIGRFEPLRFAPRAMHAQMQRFRRTRFVEEMRALLRAEMQRGPRPG